MVEKEESFKDFKERVVHKKDSLFSILFIVPLTVRIAYLLKKWNLNVDPNYITLTRLFIIFFGIILLLFLAPILNLKIFYLIVAILFYISLFTDWLDGQVARALNKTSDKGAFLDSIADRTGIIIFFTLIISIGFWINDLFIIFGGIFLFILKTFHMMIITKLFYYKKDIHSGKNINNVFGGKKALNKVGMMFIISFFEKLNNKYLKIKKWCPMVFIPEVYFVTIILPALLVYLNIIIFTTYLLYFYIISYSMFFTIRIKNLLQDY
tara:strand:- start:168 stop:965 length:798 start_codon:yes stop_codon:yes gene_type:complete